MQAEIVKTRQISSHSRTIAAKTIQGAQRSQVRFFLAILSYK
jgi:hypothetical protein